MVYLDISDILVCVNRIAIAFTIVSFVAVPANADVMPPSHGPALSFHREVCCKHGLSS